MKQEPSGGNMERGRALGSTFPPGFVPPPWDSGPRTDRGWSIRAPELVRALERAYALFPRRFACCDHCAPRCTGGHDTACRAYGCTNVAA